MSLPFMPSHFLSDADCVDGKTRASPFVIVESRNEWGVTIERADLIWATRTGAVIRLATLRPLPDEIAIYFPDNGLQRNGRVRWRDERRFGIELDGSHGLPNKWYRKSHSAGRCGCNRPRIVRKNYDG